MRCSELYYTHKEEFFPRGVLEINTRRRRGCCGNRDNRVDGFVLASRRQRHLLYLVAVVVVRLVVIIMIK